jgi:ABC-type methionine transport system permease subunit
VDAHRHGRLVAWGALVGACGGGGSGELVVEQGC